MFLMLKRIMEARGGNYEGLMDNSDHFFEVNFSVTTFEKVFYEKLDFRNAVTNDCLKISCFQSRICIIRIFFTISNSVFETVFEVTMKMTFQLVSLDTIILLSFIVFSQLMIQDNR